MSAILVAGGAGYIGSHTCVELLNAGYDVVGLDGMEGRFAMDRAEYEKDRGLFSLNGEYRNGGFSFYGETAFEAGRSDNWIFNTGFKYAF